MYHEFLLTPTVEEKSLAVQGGSGEITLKSTLIKWYP